MKSRSRRNSSSRQRRRRGPTAGTLRVTAGASFFRAAAAAWRTSGEGSEAFRSISGRTASRKPPSPRASAASARTWALSSASAASRSLRRARGPPAAQPGPRAGGAPRRPRRRTRAPARAARPTPMRRRASSADGLQGRRPAARRPGGAAARGSPDLAQRRHRGAAHGRVVVAAGAPAARAWPWRCGSAPGRAAAAQRTLQCSSSRASSSGGTACGSPIAPRLSAAARRRLRSGSDQHVHQRPHGGHGAHRAQRLHRREAQLLARVGQERQQARHHLRVADLAQRAQRSRSACAGSGSSSSGSRSRAASGSCSLPSDSTACWRTRLLSSRSAAAQQRPGTPGASISPSALRAARRTVSRGSRAQRDQGGRRLRDRAAGPASRRRGCAPATSALPSACSSSGTTRSGRHARERAHRALLDQLALVAQQLEEQHGRVLVAQPADGGHRLRAHLLRGVVDERRHEVDAARAARSRPGSGSVPCRTASSGCSRPCA